MMWRSAIIRAGHQTPESFIVCFFSLYSRDQDCQVGLNFAAQEEADTFQNAVEDKINQRQNRQGQRGNERFIFRMTQHEVSAFNDANCKPQNVYVFYCANALLTTNETNDHLHQLKCWNLQIFYECRDFCINPQLLMDQYMTIDH